MALFFLLPWLMTPMWLTELPRRPHCRTTEVGVVCATASPYSKLRGWVGCAHPLTRVPTNKKTTSKQNKQMSGCHHAYKNKQNHKEQTQIQQ